jgi:hypothetical protein
MIKEFVLGIQRLRIPMSSRTLISEVNILTSNRQCPRMVQKNGENVLGLVIEEVLGRLQVSREPKGNVSNEKFNMVDTVT